MVEYLRIVDRDKKLCRRDGERDHPFRVLDVETAPHPSETVSSPTVNGRLGSKGVNLTASISFDGLIGPGGSVP
jgi:hypothetical protein